MNNKIKFNDFQKEIAKRGKIYKSVINRVVDSGWYILGREVESFEQEFAKYLGAKYCIGVANGLEALQISLIAIGIKAGDEIITTPQSAFATSLSILAVGAKPVYCDVDSRGQMDYRKIEKLITHKTKAVMPVHLYGLSCYPEEIASICKKHKLTFVEDACQAHGSKFKGRYLGTFGEISSFSFYPTKNLGCMGDGGAIVTGDPALATKCKQIRDYGQSEKYVHKEYGLNSRLDEIQASILREKLHFLNKDNEKRRKIAKIYEEQLGNLEQISIINSLKYELPNYHLFVIKTDNRDLLKKYLKDNSIDSLVHYPCPLPDQPIFQGVYHDKVLKNVREMSTKILSLPIHPQLTVADAKTVCTKIKDFYHSQIMNEK